MIVIGDETESVLREAMGSDLDRIAREMLIAEAYRIGKLSIGQAARLLSLGINDAYGFMKIRGIPLAYSMQDLDADLASLRELRNASR